jgi:LPS export ABC transporter protein LptC
MMKGRKKIVIIIVFLLIFLSLTVIVTIGLWKEPEKALLKIMADRVDLQVRNVRYTEVGDSGMKWEILADTVTYEKKENLAFFDKLTVKLVTEDGRIFLMTGDRGRLNTEERDIEIDGNVTVVSDSGDRFRTDQLRYRNRDNRVETDRPVAMETGNVRINGVGMILSLNEKKVAILSQIRARSPGEMRGRR